jgi:hypothetical protein
VSFILTAIGFLLIVVALAGIALGIHMAIAPKTRASGKLFAIWWVPGLAAASGVLMRDVVTFVVGMVCFLVAGAVIVLENRKPRKVQVRDKSSLAGGTGDNSRLDSERTTKKNRTKDSDRAAS